MVSKYGLTVEYEQYDSYYEARQGEHNCSDGSIIAGDFRHTACLRFGDAVDVGGNRLGHPPGRTWTMPRVVMQNVSRARHSSCTTCIFLPPRSIYCVAATSSQTPAPPLVSRPDRELAVFLFPRRPLIICNPRCAHTGGR